MSHTSPDSRFTPRAPKQLLLRKDNTVWIVPGEQAAHLEVIPLDNAEAEELAAALAHLTPYGVRIVPYYPTNSLLIYGDPQGVKEVIRVIKGGARRKFSCP